MSGFKRGRTRTVLTWLECYGLYREAGVNQYITIEALEGNTEFVAASQIDMETSVAAPRAEKAAATKYAGDVLMAVGGVVLAAFSETIAGAVIGALLLAVGAILSFFAELFYPPCDKYHCTGHDRKYVYHVNKYKEHVKGIVGVDQGGLKGRGDSCSCSIRGHNCRFAQYMHDGLVMRGQDWEYIEGNPANSGEVRGANALVIKGRGSEHTVCNEYWRAYKHESTPLDSGTGNRIERGGVNYPELYIGLKHEPGPPHNTRYALEKKLGRHSSARDLYYAEQESLEELLTRKLGSKAAAERALKGEVPFPGMKQRPQRRGTQGRGKRRATQRRRGMQGLSGLGRSPAQRPRGKQQPSRQPQRQQQQSQQSGGRRQQQQPQSRQQGRRIVNKPSREPWTAPWKNGEQTYYYRAWRVQKILYWIIGENKTYKGIEFIDPNILCRTMKCMEDTINETSSIEDDSSFNQKRRRGSRWYASIVWMMTDIFSAGQHLIEQAKNPAEGWTLFGQILKDSGCNDATLQTLRNMAKGKAYKQSDIPWPFFPLIREVTFAQMREILINLKPHFPYEYKAPVVPQPQGEEARSTMPIVVPVLTPISFNEMMQPIPAKLGSTGPGWGTIMLGLGAAAVGAYALYSVLAPAKR